MARRHGALWGILAATIIGAAGFVSPSAFAQGAALPDWCGTAWACNIPGPASKPSGNWAAISMGTVGHTGIVTGQPSADQAMKLADAKCAAGNGNQSCMFSKALAGCLGMAAFPGGDVHTVFEDKPDRTAAWIDALKACNNAGCQVQMTACAGDDPRTPPPLPLPPNLSGGKVDPAVVGTWEFPINPGRWVWEIAANGTYQSHTEGPDGAPSQAGTFVANGGTWTLSSAAGFADIDGGTYLMAGPNTMVMTGKLGTGAWQRIVPAPH